ncbi:TLC domain-containing protein 4-B-like [Antedon mediterranea]|uniref:TLC domain-containing protein 4-B-like n=1 Tax=Antedon mediterranea TaxID=105859 RepID=UPI003AF4607A
MDAEEEFVAQLSDDRLKYFALILATFCCYMFGYLYISPTLSRRFYKGYDNLSDLQKRDWNTRGFSTVNSVITSSLCVYILLFDEKANLEHIWARSTLSSINISLLTGYILCDLAIVLTYFPLIESLSYSSHHLAAVCAYIYSLTYNGLLYFANFRVLAEISTPFVNFRWIMSTIGVKKSHKLFIINGLMMVAVFFSVRILTMPYYYYKMISVWRSPIVDTLSLHMKICWMSASIVLDSINLLWFRKMFNGARKILKENSKTQIEDSNIRKREKGK